MLRERIARPVNTPDATAHPHRFAPSDSQTSLNIQTARTDMSATGFRAIRSLRRGHARQDRQHRDGGQRDIRVESSPGKRIKRREREQVQDETRALGHGEGGLQRIARHHARQSIGDRQQVGEQRRRPVVEHAAGAEDFLRIIGEEALDIMFDGTFAVIDRGGDFDIVATIARTSGRLPPAIQMAARIA